MGLQDKVKKIWDKNKKAVKIAGLASLFAAGFSIYMCNNPKKELKPLVMRVDMTQSSDSVFRCPGEDYPNSMALNKAIDICYNEVRANPQNGMLRERLGDLFYENGNNNDALFQHREAVRAEPKNIELRRDLLGLYINLGMAGDAIKEAEYIVGMKGRSIEDIARKGVVYGIAGLHKEAVKTLEEVIKIDPLYVNAYHDLGISYLRLGDLKNAEKVTNKALNLKDDPDLHYLLGDIYFYKKSFGKAKFEYLKALAIDDGTNSASLHTCLGEIYNIERNYTESMKYLNKAISISPNFYYAHYHLAMAYKGLGKINRGFYNEAEKELKITLELNPAFSEGHDQLGMLHLKKGGFRKAKEEFRLALKYDPNNSSARANLNRL